MSGGVEDLRARAARSYLEAKVRSATPAELISLLYEGLARQVHQAAAAIDQRDVAEKGSAIGRALSILAELRKSIDHSAGGEVAVNLERLYVYWTALLTEANLNVKRAPLDELEPQLAALRSAWNQAVVPASAPQLQPAAVATAAAR